MNSGGYTVNNNKEEEKKKDEEDNNEEKYETISKYYSQKTKNYLKLISSLENDSYIAYQYEFQKDSKGSFANNYQYLYENDTSLIPNDSEVGNYLFQEESYLKKETDEINYYKNILKKDPPKHYIYGPSFIQEDYNKGQKLYNPNAKLNDTKDWEGVTISLNIKQQPFMGNSNGGYIFGWGKPGNVPGFYIALTYGILAFKQGRYIIRYDYEDSVKLGYNDSIPEKRYLTFRPLTDNRWHQVIASMRKVTKEDEQYLTELNLKEGQYKSEFFIDGESRKNSTAYPSDNYGDLQAFDFGNDSEMKHNSNYFIDNIIVLKKGINITEVKILYESIDQEAPIVIPDIPSERCKIPGEKYGIKPDEIYPDSEYPLKFETRFFQFTSKWSCLVFSYEQFLKDRLKEFCSDHLKTSDLHHYHGKLQDYQLQNHYRYDMFDVLRYYLPQINEKFKNLETFKNYVKITSTGLNGINKKSHVISNFGYWISS